MIGKICPRGDDLAGLIRYLYGPGRCEEHTDPHIVAGYLDPDSLEPGFRPDGRRDFRRLVSRLRLPHDRQGSLACAKPVWHCPLRAAPTDRMLSDAEWAQVARDVMARTGLSPHGQDDQGVRWIAVRHGPGHIHLVAMLARQDGARVSTWNSRYRVRDACLAAEQRYGLRSTAPADRTAARRPTRAENEKAARRSLDETPRVTLRRQVTTAAASANSEDEFFARLDQAKVLVRKRFSITSPGQVTGYSVGLPGDTARDGGPIWYGGGKLAADLTWPKLRQRWTPGRAAPGCPRPDLTAQERNAIWEDATRTAADAAAQIRNLAGTNPAAAADAAWATSDALHVAAAMLGSRVLRQAADAYDRAARSPYGRIPPPSPVGNQLRQAARLLSAFAYLTQDRSMAPILLITRLAALAEAVAELRQSQQHAAQAAAALRAARHLHAATAPATRARPAPAPRTRPDPQPDSAARLAAMSFPKPARPGRQPPAPGQPGPGPASPPPPRRPPPPRPRGPTR
ncbi:MAG: hypothetical protein ACRDPD_09980 [Streptosporangiaceae bacterium]